MNEIKAPSIRINVKVKNDHVEKTEKRIFDTSQVQLIGCLTGRTSLSHEVGVLQICYLLICSGGWPSQHCCVVATAILYQSQ